MAITHISGELANAATLGVNSDRLKVQMKDSIFLLEPRKNILTTLANRVSREKIQSDTAKWLEKERTPELTRVNYASGYSNSATSIAVDNGPYAKANTTARIQRTGEVIMITAVSGSDWTITRSWGGTAAAAIVDNDQITILGGTAQQGADPETSRSTKSVTAYNYTEIVRDAFGVTRTLNQTAAYGGNILAAEQREHAIEHAVYLELKSLFGERAYITSGNEPKGSMGGMEEWISTNRKNYGGHLTLVELFDQAEDAFRYGSDRKMLLCGAAPVSNISLMSAGRLRSVSSDKTFGISIKELLTPHGTWLIAKHHLFAGDTYGKYMMSIDLDNIGWAYLQDTILKTNIQTTGADKRKDEFLTEATLMRMQELTHALGTNAA